MAKEAKADREINQLMQVRLEKMAALEEKGISPFGHKFVPSHHIAEIIANQEQLIKDATEVTIAGRLMAKRGQGKAGFGNVEDLSGNIQIYSRLDVAGEDNHWLFKKADIGDIIGIRGKVFVTEKGELSVSVLEFTHLSKSLRPLPEKFHGLTDVEARYRQRYVDLIMNKEVKNTFVMRSRIVSAIREYLDGENFLEVETPVLHTIAGGAAARPFITYHNALDMQLYMRIALELHLKRLIVGGLEKVYEIGRVFRNEGIDTRHNPEFTLLELYQAYGDYTDMMDITENMIRTVAKKVCGSAVITYGEHTVDLESPWQRVTMAEAVKKYTGVDYYTASEEELKACAAKYDIDTTDMPKGKILSELFEAAVEENLIQPTFITEYPIEVSPLAKRNPENPEMGKRTVPFGRYLYIEREDFMEEPVKKFFRLAPGKEVRLKGAYFVTCTDFVKDDNGNITEIHCTYDPESKGGNSPDGRKVKGTLHWVCADDCVTAEARLYDYMMLDNPDDPSGEMIMNPESIIIRDNCKAEPSLKEAKKGDRFQFMRNGYFCVDTKDTTDEKLVFNRIVPLKSSFKIGK